MGQERQLVRMEAKEESARDERPIPALSKEECYQDEFILSGVLSFQTSGFQV